MAELVSDSRRCCREENNRRLANVYGSTKIFCVLLTYWKFLKIKLSCSKIFQQENSLESKFKLRFIPRDSTPTFSLLQSYSFYAPFFNPKWGNWSNAFCTYHQAHRFSLPAAILTPQIHRPSPVSTSGAAFWIRETPQTHPLFSALLRFTSLSYNHWYHFSIESDYWIKRISV